MARISMWVSAVGGLRARSRCWPSRPSRPCVVGGPPPHAHPRGDLLPRSVASELRIQAKEKPKIRPQAPKREHRCPPSPPGGGVPAGRRPLRIRPSFFWPPAPRQSGVS